MTDEYKSPLRNRIPNHDGQHASDLIYVGATIDEAIHELTAAVRRDTDKRGGDVEVLAGAIRDGADTSSISIDGVSNVLWPEALEDAVEEIRDCAEGVRLDNRGDGPGDDTP